MKMDGVNEDDLLEIKQDISSLRYELRDDRRREIVRSSSHIDAVKRDIMRTMSHTRGRVLGGSYRIPRDRTTVTEELELSSSDDDDEKDSVSLLFTPPANSALPEILQECVLDRERKEKRRRSSEASGGICAADRVKLLATRRGSDRTHSLLRKTDTAFSFPINGIMMSPASPKTPKSVLKSPESARVSKEIDAASIEAIQNLRDELNQKLDFLISSIAERAANAKDVSKSSDENSNLTPSPKKNSKVNFTESEVA